MPRSIYSLTLSEAKRMLTAGEAKAASLGIPYNIAVVDAGGALIAFTRQDGALIGSIDLAIGKAVTARIFDKRTSDLAEMAQPGAPLFGIEQSNNGKIVIFGGGLPVRIDGDRAHSEVNGNGCEPQLLRSKQPGVPAPPHWIRQRLAG